MGGGGAAGTTQSVRGNCKFFEGTNLTIVDGMHHFIMYILSVVQPVRKGRSVQRGWGGISNSFRSHTCISVRSLLYA